MGEAIRKRYDNIIGSVCTTGDGFYVKIVLSSTKTVSISIAKFHFRTFYNVNFDTFLIKYASPIKKTKKKDK